MTSWMVEYGKEYNIKLNMHTCAMQFTDISLLNVYRCSSKASGAVHFTGMRPLEISRDEYIWNK